MYRLASSARAASRLASVSASRVAAVPRRAMGGGGHGHATPKYEGIEAIARQYLPENYHFVYAVLGGYAAIIALVQIRGSFASAAKISATPMPTAPDYHTRAFRAIVVSSDIPSFGTPEWEAFVEKDPNNFQVWLESGFKTA